MVGFLQSYLLLEREAGDWELVMQELEEEAAAEPLLLAGFGSRLKAG